jgi:uncharacterized membrane protein (UPF0127 family)
MKVVGITNATRDTVVCKRCSVADNLFTRVRGLLGRSGLEVDEGLLINPCPSIHMFGMKFALDVIFITADNLVTDFVENIGPGKAYVAKAHQGKARAAIELPVGAIARSGTQIGDALVFHNSISPHDSSPTL